MKDPILLETPAAARDYVYGLLRTDAFRRSDYVAGWIERFAAHPSVFARMSDEQLETPHFGTFFGMTYLRDYVEPARREALLRFLAWFPQLTSVGAGSGVSETADPARQDPRMGQIDARG